MNAITCIRAPRRYPPCWLRQARTGALSAVLLLLLTMTPRAMAQEEAAEARRMTQVFGEVAEFLLENYVDASRLDADRLLDGALEGLFEALEDPHSAYIHPSDVSQINDLVRGEFGGVGMYIAKHSGGGIEVIAPIEGNPAHRAGLQAGDVIVAINGEPADDFEISDVVSRLRGPPGTTVGVTVQRNNSISFDVVIERAMIEVDTVRSAMIDEEIGYLRIVQFTLLTPDRVADALRELDSATSLIVDLRSNPGGLLAAVAQVADLFLHAGVIVSTQSRVATENNVHRATADKTLVDASVPIVVLIDRGSASASEILAAALRENGRGFLLGEQSYGKASVQQVRHFDRRAIKVTTAYYLTPSGASIDGVGVSPHREFGDPPLSEQEEAQVIELFDSGRIRTFVRVHGEPSETLTEEFIADLRQSGVDLPPRVLRRLVRDEVVRRMPNRPVYDLRFDVVLREAVRLLEEDLVPAHGIHAEDLPAARGDRPLRESAAALS